MADFKAAHEKALAWVCNRGPDENFIFACDVRNYLRALEAEGFHVVPSEATGHMLLVGDKLLREALDDPDKWSTEEFWQAMLAVAKGE